MISYLCPEGPEAFSGGCRKLYDHVEILKSAGFEAEAVLAPINPGLSVEANSGDLLVVPEVYGDLLRTLAPGVPRISLNQNAHLTWANVADLSKHPYTTTPELLAVFTVSDQNRRLLEFAFPDVRIQRFYTSAGRPNEFYCGPFPHARRICFFGRKKADRARLVIAMLAQHGSLTGWEVIQMDGMSDSQVAETMRTAAIFLSFSDLEGFASPPFEAMVCGCQVIGFTGQGSVEYFHPAGGAIPDDDVLCFASCVDLAVSRYSDLEAAASGTERSPRLMKTYSRDREVNHLVGLFKEFA